MPYSSDALAHLASTQPAPASAMTLRAGIRARRLLLLKALLTRVDGRRAALDAAVRQRFDRDWLLLEQVERGHRAAVREVLDYPLTGAWLGEALKSPEGPAFEHQLAHFSGIVLAATVRAGRQLSTTVHVTGGVLMLPGLGALRGEAGTARLAIGSGRVRIADGGHDWSGLRTLPGGTAVLDDLDPYRTPPGGVGSPRRPAAERADCRHRAWARRWRGAQRLLAATDRGRAAEIPSLLGAVVPMTPGGRDDPRGGGTGTVVSATMRAAPGAVLTSLPAGAQEMAEVLVHEAHHTKMTVLHELVPLWGRGRGAYHRVGWRPDPRPVPAILQGAYAHLALTDLWWRACGARDAPRSWRRRSADQFETHREQVGEALSILLESDELTAAGREFVRGMRNHHASLGVANRPVG
ncbi:aKG-HExxH-type peptide beta-hydroxylase [Streptomyces sp. O3]